jgi:hypothetical protein
MACKILMYAYYLFVHEIQSQFTIEYVQTFEEILLRGVNR